MELTTNQIYGIFAMLTAAAFAGMLFYCIGLRTGRAAGFKHGRATAAIYWRKLLSSNNQRSNDLRCQLAAAKRKALLSENDREASIRDLQQALTQAAANRLNDDDLVQLGLVAQQLGIAAKQHERSGSTKANRAALARDYICDLTQRVRRQAAQSSRVLNHADLPLPRSTWERIDDAQQPGAQAPMCL